MKRDEQVFHPITPLYTLRRVWLTLEGEQDFR